MSAVWILVPIAILIIAAVVAFPLWFTHRRMRHDHDLASAEQYLEQIGKSKEDAAFGRPAPPKHDSGVPGSGVPESGVPARSAAPRGRHAAPETSRAQDSVSGSGNRG